MKITSQLLRSKARPRGPLQSVEHLDLSNLGLECIEKLAPCSKLQILKLNDNCIDYVDNLDVCCQLWKLDLSNNKIQNLAGLRRIVALGTLNLANNELGWAELANIRHMIILDLSLHGNPRLERDPYYRMHVIDCLPNVWMLDGRIVTSAEREQAQQFFEDSELTRHPVRHKLSREQFTPSAHKNIQVNGVFGERTEHLLRRFPVHARLNVEMDRKRLQYLSSSVQQDLLIESRSTNRKLLTSSDDYLMYLLESRSDDRIKANMLLLLLVASLQFAIPSNLMLETLKTTQLQSIGRLEVMELFLLPKTLRCLVVSLLLSAVKIDKDVGQEKDLYDKLYLSIYHSVSELTRLAHASGRQSETGGRKTSALYVEAKCLVAAEVVQLMCVVPAFFDYCTKDTGTKNLLVTATNEPNIIHKASKLLRRAEQDKDKLTKVFQDTAQMILAAVQVNALNIINNTGIPRGQAVRLNSVTVDPRTQGLSRASPRRPQSTAIYAAPYHASGRSSPDRKPTRVKSGKPQSRNPQARLGDRVLLGPQNVGRVISLPESDIVLIQADVVPAETGAMVTSSKNPEEHYNYVDMKQLYWDALAGFWRPTGTVGDRITVQAVQETADEFLESARRMAHTGRSCAATPTPLHSPPTSPRPTLVTPRSFLEETNSRDSKQVKLLPKSVSSQLQQMLDLNLEKTLGDSDLGQQTSDTRQTDEQTADADTRHTAAMESRTDRPGTGRPRTCGKGEKENYDTSKSKREADSGEDVESLYNRGGLSRRSSLESREESELDDMSTIASRPQTATAAFRQQKNRDGTNNQTSTWKSQEASQGGWSRSGKPTEAQTSIGRPSTARCTKSRGPASVTHGSLDIEIPQVSAEGMESDVSENVTGRGVGGRQWDVDQTASGGSTGRSGRRTRQSAQMKRPAQHGSGPRPMSAVDTYKMIVSNNPYYMSTYQNLRTEAWKRGNSPRSSRAGSRPESPPPQRPSSPFDKTRNSSTQRSVSIQRGNSWLAGGRDLYWESVRSRPRSGHTPGWKEGLPQRPYSAAVLRSLRRTQTPNVVTPSSLAYESAVARGEIPAEEDNDDFDIASLCSSSSFGRDHQRSMTSGRDQQRSMTSSLPRQLGTVPNFHAARPNTPDSWDEGGFR